MKISTNYREIIADEIKFCRKKINDSRIQKELVYEGKHLLNQSL